MRFSENNSRFPAMWFSVVWLLVVVGMLLCGVGVAVGEPSERPFEIVPNSWHFAPSNDQAGAHANWVFSFDFAHEENGSTYNDVRTIVNEFPTGFDASNTAVPTCTEAQLLSANPAVQGVLPDCPIASQIGQISTEIALPSKSTPAQVTFPVYYMEVSSYGTTAEVGYNVVGQFTLISQVNVRPSDEGLTAVTYNIPKLGEAHKITVTLWGVPAAHEHDAARGAICGEEGEIPPVCHNEFGSPQEARVTAKPFLSNPTSCGAFQARMTANSWEEPAFVPIVTTEVGPIVECDRVPFDPSIEVNPSTRSAESPTGLDVSLVVPQAWENPFTISTANLDNAKVVLPEGMTINPSAGSGLGSCTPAQYASETALSLPGEGCPPESKIGSIVIETPLLAETIPGAIYIATPYDNPFGEPAHPDGSLLALYVVAKDPERGLLIKVAGKIEPNPVTGQLTTTFDGNPQQPFSKFTLKFRPGATAPLVSPPTCGSYSTQAELSPWSAPSEPSIVSSEPFAISSGVREGPCPTGGVPPFKPQVLSGTDDNDAGAYSPFYLRILREDGEQEITKFTTILPPGLTGNLTGIPFCPEAGIETARVVSGLEEIEHPSCPASSEIGHTIVSAGVGTVLAQTPGRIYLAGPYHGSSLSIVSITSAKVGPFDLGTVVIRFALKINPLTGQVEVDGSNSDPIPHIIEGIVVHVREVRVYMDRHDFTLNPTTCNPSTISETITGSGADPSNPADQIPVGATAPFQTADCSSLKFKPSFKASVSGRTSRANGTSLTVKLTYPADSLGTQANIKSVKVDLPKQLPSRLTTLQKACTAATFAANPALCPADSKVGEGKAITPILPVPLEGPAYFVSYGGAKFPELVIVLQGYGFTIDLHGETFINKAGITSSTFHAIPDEPVGSFELTLPNGHYSALAANGNLCTSKLTMPTAFTAQNGVEIHQSTPISVTGCSKQATRKSKKTKKAKRPSKTKQKK